MVGEFLAHGFGGGFVPLFRQTAASVKRVFQDVSLEEQKRFEDVLKKIGKRAEALAREEAGSINRNYS
jgi:hypothetical protein